jgi:activating signal cointegrator complex subunit 3
MKVLLPENVERIDNKQYEEVTIPVSEPAPLSVGNKLIAVTSLDEVSNWFNSV